MATYRPEQRGRAQSKQARELSKPAAQQAKAKATAAKGDKPTPAEILKEAMERR